MASRRNTGQSSHSSPVTLHLVGPDSWTDVPAALRYDAADPYAVRVVFGDADEADPADAAVTWLMDRDLLRAGMTRPAGEGDVRLWPAHAAADLMYLHLRAPSGEALFELSRVVVAAFLRATEVLVPVGAEAGLLEVDRGLDALLERGGADPGWR